MEEIQPIQPRQVVAWFSRRMEEKLRTNDHKGGWQSFSNDTLHFLLQNELKELDEAMNVNCRCCGKRMDNPHNTDIIDECRDVSNVAMFIADNEYRRKLPAGKIPYEG